MTIKDILTALPPGARFAIYALFALAVFVNGGLAVADVNTGKAADVLTYIGGALGLLAAGNVELPKRVRDQAGAIAVAGLELLVGFIAGLFLGFLLWNR